MGLKFMPLYATYQSSCSARSNFVIEMGFKENQMFHIIILKDGFFMLFEKVSDL